MAVRLFEKRNLGHPLGVSLFLSLKNKKISEHVWILKKVYFCHVVG